MFPLFTALSRVQLLAIAAAVAVGVFGVWLTRHDAKVVNKERVRVETTGAKVDAKAQEKRRAAESKPDLSRYLRD